VPQRPIPQASSSKTLVYLVYLVGVVCHLSLGFLCVFENQRDQTDKRDQTDLISRSPMACAPELRQLEGPGIVPQRQTFGSAM